MEVRALALANLGIAEFWAGGIGRRARSAPGGGGLALEAGNDYVLLVAESYLAIVDARQGRLDDAHSRARTAIELAERRGLVDVPHIAIAYVALAAVHIWLESAGRGRARRRPRARGTGAEASSRC